MSPKLKSLISIGIIAVLFVALSYLVQTHLGFFEKYIGYGFFGMAVYVFVTIIAIVIAPVSTLPLVPVASNLFGWQVTALLSILGWVLGAMIAFILARVYGVKLVRRLVPLGKINELEKRVPQKNIFWSVVFLRMTIPVDVLSYALGLLSRIKTRDYFFATVIGVAPFAFVWAYLGTVPFIYQIIALAIAAVIVLVGVLVGKKRMKPVSPKRI